MSDNPGYMEALESLIHSVDVYLGNPSLEEKRILKSDFVKGQQYTIQRYAFMSGVLGKEVPIVTYYFGLLNVEGNDHILRVQYHNNELIVAEYSLGVSRQEIDELILEVAPENMIEANQEAWYSHHNITVNLVHVTRYGSATKNDISDDLDLLQAETVEIFSDAYKTLFPYLQENYIVNMSRNDEERFIEALNEKLGLDSPITHDGPDAEAELGRHVIPYWVLSTEGETIESERYYSLYPSFPAIGDDEIGEYRLEFGNADDTFQLIQEVLEELNLK